MKFYNRKKELELLNTLYHNTSSFVVIYGKRRVGKTELIRQFSKNKKTLYIFVDNTKSEKQLLNEYQNLIKDLLNLDYTIQFDTFKDFLKFIFKQEIIIVFDEFQRFLKINPSIINYFQEVIDSTEKKCMLITSGSSFGMIKKIFIENEAPLFKRAELKLKLEDFSFKEIQQILKDLNITDIEEQIKLYGLFGGNIYYYNLIEKFNCKTFEEVLDTLLFNEVSPLKLEIQDWFIEQFGKINKTYYEILFAIAQGKNTKKEISDVITSVKETSLHSYLEDLIDLLGVIEYKIPITEEHSSKKGRYFLSQNFFKFWFKYIYANVNLFKIQDFKKLKKIILNTYNEYLGFVIEDIFSQYLIELNKNHEIYFENSGTWWNRQGEEIDIVMTNKNNKTLYICECKFTSEKIGIDILEKLKEKSKKINWMNNQRKTIYVLFSKSGFTKNLKNKKNEEELILYDLSSLM